MIKLQDLTFRYHGAESDALAGVSLEVPAGAFVGVTGSAGAGKTSLLRAVSGLIPSFYTGDFAGSCTVAVQGTVFDTRHAHPEELARHIGFVFQDFENQLVTSVVEDEIAFGLENFGEADIEERISETLRTVGIENLRHRPTNALSGGQKQKVALAAILAMRPAVLLLDEPSAELDPGASRLVFTLLQKLSAENGTTIVVVEQKRKLLEEFCTTVYEMSEGRLYA
jgi:energy-coupling factor transporter ATP-binding protein EcfA2